MNSQKAAEEAEKKGVGMEYAAVQTKAGLDNLLQ